MNKSLIATLILAIFLAAISCDDREFLGVDLQDIDSGDFFSNETAFDRGVLGIYQKLVFFYNSR